MSKEELVPRTFKIEGKEYTVNALQRVDDNGIKIDDKKLEDVAIHKAMVMYAQDHGFITSDEIKNFRKKVGLNQRDLALLLGMSPTTIAMYELDARPSESNSKLLQLVINDKNSLRKMASSPNIPDRLREKIKRYFHGKTNKMDDYDLTSPYSAIQFAHWFIANNNMNEMLTGIVEPLSENKLQLLLYFAYGEFLAKTHNQLFKEDIIRKSVLPFIQEVHDDFNTEKNDTYYFIYSEIETNRDITDILHHVIKKYGQYTAMSLSMKFAKKGTAWSKTKPDEVIKDNLIFDDFAN